MTDAKNILPDRTGVKSLGKLKTRLK